MDRLFVAFKPKEISSNAYLSQLKRKYGEKKAGFSGTLDPFASGALVVAFGAYTRLFRFLRKSPKIYRATIWLGAKSESGDNRNFVSIDEILPLNLRASPRRFHIRRALRDCRQDRADRYFA